MELKKYDKIYALGHEENKDIFLNPETIVCIQEKVDGANMRVYIHNGILIFGSRTQQLTDDLGQDTNLQKNFIRGVNFVREKLKDKDLTSLNGKVLFMENMVKHTLNYNWEITPPVLGFDIYDSEKDEYLPWNMSKCLYDDLGIEFVPILRICMAKEIGVVNDDMVPISKYTSNRAEGIVFKTLNPRIYAKYVRNEFKEDNAREFGSKNVKYNSDDDSGLLIGKYCTNQRIEKNILKLIDEGNKLDLPMMSKLPNLVYQDIWDEHLKDIIYSKITINLNLFKKLVTSRCLTILKTMIVNNTLNTCIV